ncbi:MAG: sigma-70 family RNA polymerase sigma factor [Anaerolineales bacterium]|nr:sigma-70 family RNA polymerase sigma factor [Anaerolineales bacterium]
MNDQSSAAATATKVCTKCAIEKPGSEFHRRGSRRQNICKTCRLENAKQPHAPQVKKDNSANYQAIGARIEELEPRLRRIAQNYSRCPHEAGDIYSYICEKLLQQADPTDSDSRILTTARRRAKDYLTIEDTYNMYIGDEEEIGGTPKKDDEEVADAFETFKSGSSSLEDTIIEDEERESITCAISRLSEDNRKVIAMLADGKNQAEIAKELKVSRAAVTIRMNLVREKLNVLMAETFQQQVFA